MNPLLFKIGGALLAVIALVLLLWRLDHVTAQRDEAEKELKTVKAEIAVLKADAALKEQASIERQNDDVVSDTQARELENARNHQSDDPDTRRLRSLCVVLRQQSPARFNATAACRRFDSQTGAPAS